MFKCTVNNASKDTFFVPVSQDNLDSNADTYETFRRWKQGKNATFDKDIVSKGNQKANIKEYCSDKIQEYLQLEPDVRRKCVVFEEPGHYQVQGVPNSLGTDAAEPGMIVIFGNNVILPVTKGLKVEQLEIFHVGSTQLPKMLVPEVDPVRIQTFLNKLIAFHKTNLGALVSLLGFERLALLKKRLMEHSIKVGACHLVGEGGTGKSSAAGHVEMMGPRLFNNKNKPYQRSPMSISKLSVEISRFSAPPVQDKPRDLKKQNDFLDITYEGRLEINAQSKHHTDIPQTCPIYVWGNEQRNLAFLGFPRALFGRFSCNSSPVSCSRFLAFLSFFPFPDWAC